jgi:hypothetical protein
MSTMKRDKELRRVISEELEALKEFETNKSILNFIADVLSIVEGGTAKQAEALRNIESIIDSKVDRWYEDATLEQLEFPPACIKAYNSFIKRVQAWC